MKSCRFAALGAVLVAFASASAFAAPAHRASTAPTTKLSSHQAATPMAAPPKAQMKMTRPATDTMAMPTKSASAKPVSSPASTGQETLATVDTGEGTITVQYMPHAARNTGIAHMAKLEQPRELRKVVITVVTTTITSPALVPKRSTGMSQPASRYDAVADASYSKASSHDMNKSY